MDNDLFGLTEALFPVLTNSSNQISRQGISDTPLTTPKPYFGGLLWRRKRSLVLDLMELTSTGVVPNIMSISQDKFVKRNLQKTGRILGQVGPCSTWVFGYLKYWFDIICLVLKDQYSLFLI